MSANNQSISRRIGNPNDEFYTLPETVEGELKHYSAFLEGKRIYLSADGTESAFWQYFAAHFRALRLEALTATKYAPGGKGIKATLTRDGFAVEQLEGDGDFRSEECRAILRDCDCVITNPPFSIFRDFLFSTLEAGKDFVFLGNILGLTYSAVFDAFHAGRFRLGYSTGTQTFLRPDGSRQALRGIRWFTSFAVSPSRPPLRPAATFDASRYPVFDRFPAVRFVRTVRDIPRDYPEALAVPFTVFDFDLSGWEVLGRVGEPRTVDGKRVFQRAIIRRQHCEGQSAKY